MLDEYVTQAHFNVVKIGLAFSFDEGRDEVAPSRKARQGYLSLFINARRGH
jgi:hypothetical protein